MLSIREIYAVFRASILIQHDIVNIDGIKRSLINTHGTRDSFNNVVKYFRQAMRIFGDSDSFVPVSSDFFHKIYTGQPLIHRTKLSELSNLLIVSANPSFQADTQV